MGTKHILRPLLTCVTFVWVGVSQPASCASVESIVRGTLTENGRPAANIKVVLVNSTGHLSDPAYTDKEGLYTFHGVNHTDRYVLRAWVSAEQPPIDFPIIFTGKGAEVWPLKFAAHHHKHRMLRLCQTEMYESLSPTTGMLMR